MSSKQYITITHYKEREFYFLNYAIHTNDGFITKDIEQFHQNEKEAFIERIHTLQAKYPSHHVISLSLSANQVVKDKEDPSRASAKIFNGNYVIQEKIDIGNIPVTLYFSPFTILYEEYKHKLNDNLTLMIGLFDRKLYIMFATKEKVQQSWILGTRGLTEKQVADRVYKTMKAYYKISFKFADHIEMLISDESPKLLKVLKTELSMNILPTQKTIHTLLHNIGSDQRKFVSSFLKSSLPLAKETAENKTNEASLYNSRQEFAPIDSLDDIRLNSTSNSDLNNYNSASFLDRIKSMFDANSTVETTKTTSLSLLSFIPLSLVLLVGIYFSMQNKIIQDKLYLVQTQSYVQTSHALLALSSQDVFNAMGKSAELTSAKISNEHIELKGVVWGIEPLRNKLTELYNDGEFIIKPLENFMTEFSFKSKI